MTLCICMLFYFIYFIFRFSKTEYFYHCWDYFFPLLVLLVVVVVDLVLVIVSTTKVNLVVIKYILLSFCWGLLGSRHLPPSSVCYERYSQHQALISKPMDGAEHGYRGLPCSCVTTAFQSESHPVSYVIWWGNNRWSPANKAVLYILCPRRALPWFSTFSQNHASENHSTQDYTGMTGFQQCKWQSNYHQWSNIPYSFLCSAK